MTEELSDKKQAWQKHFETFISSGLSKRAYCKANDLNYYTFNYHWKQQNKKLSKEKQEPLKKFTRVKISSCSDSVESLEIYFPNGTHIKLPVCAKEIHLKQLITLLAQ